MFQLPQAKDLFANHILPLSVVNKIVKSRKFTEIESLAAGAKASRSVTLEVGDKANFDISEHDTGFLAVNVKPIRTAAA